MTYHLDGGGDSSLQLSNPEATEATLTDLQCNASYTINVVATAGEHRREGVTKNVTFLPLQGMWHALLEACICCDHMVSVV